MFKGDILKELLIPTESSYAVVIQDYSIDYVKYYFQKNNVDIDVIDEVLGTAI